MSTIASIKRSHEAPIILDVQGTVSQYCVLVYVPGRRGLSDKRWIWSGGH